jgi:hypothetical protein
MDSTPKFFILSAVSFLEILFEHHLSIHDDVISFIDEVIIFLGLSFKK